MPKEAKLEGLRKRKESELTQLRRWEKFIEDLRRYNEQQKKEQRKEQGRRDIETS